MWACLTASPHPSDLSQPEPGPSLYPVILSSLFGRILIMIYCESKIEVVITRVAVYDPAFIDLVNVLRGNKLGLPFTIQPS